MIPKIIHYCWLSEDPFPPLVERCLTSWKQHLEGYELCRWDIGNAPNVPWVVEAYESKKYAFAADYIRFYALNQRGGIYLDADVEVLKSFDALLANRSFIGYDKMGDIEAAIIGAEQGCLWIKECLDAYEGRHFKQNDGSLAMHTVPFLIHRVLQKHHRLHSSDSTSVRYYGDLTTFPAVYFSPKNIFAKDIQVESETICIHHFEGQWVKHTPFFVVKRMMHQVVLFLFGQKAHQKIARVFRRLLGIG